jgi:hypothetical protein
LERKWGERRWRAEEEKLEKEWEKGRGKLGKTGGFH